MSTYEASVITLGEDAKVLGQGDEAAEEEGTVGADQAEGSDVGHLVIGKALCLARLQEVDVCHQDRDPGQQTEDGHQVNEVSEDHDRVIGDVHHGEQTKSRREGKGRNGYTALVGPGKDLGGMALSG